MILKHLPLVAGIWLLAGPAWSQNSTVSPYSRYGIGELQFQGSVKQTAMGRAGVAVYDGDRINMLNPAALARLETAVLEAAMNANITRQSTQSVSQTTNGASLRYFSMGFPLVKEVWGAALGLRPYSSAGYEVNDIYQDPDCQCGRIQSTFSGSGDINSYFLGTGLAPFGKKAKRFYASALYDSLKAADDSAAIRRHEKRIEAVSGLSAGIHAAWLFGTINRTRAVDFIDSTGILDTRHESGVTPGGVYLTFGVFYRLPLNNDSFLNLGLTGSPSWSLSAKRNIFWYTYRSNNFFIDLQDTVQRVSDEKGKLKIPMVWTAGAAFGVKDRWVATADFSAQAWSEFESFGVRDSLLDLRSVSAGMEIIPAPGSPQYWKNIYYRLGGYYNSSVLQVKGHRINDYGITIGFGIPVLKADHSRALSPIYQQKAVIQFAVEAGQTGTTADGLLKQQYLRFHLGVVFKELWFIKRKYD